MSTLLKNIDQKVINYFHFFFQKRKYFNNFICQKIFTEKKRADLLSNFKKITPNVYKLAFDLHSVYNSNKNFILYIIRVYIYLSVFFYIITFFTITIAFYYEYKSLLFIAEVLGNFYKIGSTPLRKVKRTIKKCLSPFTYIIGKIFEKIDKRNKLNIKPFKPTNECMGNEKNEEDPFEKVPEPGKSQGMSASEFEILCMKRKLQQTKMASAAYRNLYACGASASTAMNYDMERPDFSFKRYFADLKKEKEDMDLYKYCPDWETYHRINNNKK